MISYNYEVNGTASNDQTWSATGQVVVPDRGSFIKAIDIAMRDSFMKLTQGKAVYGEPGKGCSGPYTITKLSITEAK